MMNSANISSRSCASEILNTVPLLMYFIRSCVRECSGSPATVQQVRALAYLRRHPGSTLSSLADHMAISNATASLLVDRLVKRKLIARSNDPKERRRVMLSLTRAGRTFFKEVHDVVEHELSRVFDTLTKRRLSDLHKGISVIKDSFDTRPWREF